jgi:hypothetical protein
LSVCLAVADYPQLRVLLIVALHDNHLTNEAIG